MFIDAGTTTAILAEELAKLANLTIITKSIGVAQKMRPTGEKTDASNEIILLGGSISDRAFATVGGTTVAEILRYRADVALLSPVAIDHRHGATNFDHAETEVARAMVAPADRVVILADYSKIGQCSRIAFCSINRVDTLIINKKGKAPTVPRCCHCARSCRKSYSPSVSNAVVTVGDIEHTAAQPGVAQRAGCVEHRVRD